MKAGVKFRQGKDSDKMLVRKLLKNFIVHGKLTTTRKKAKFIRSSVERLVTYAKADSQATQNKLKSALSDRKIEEKMKKIVAPVFKDRVSGFTKITYLNQRLSDASDMARLEWSMPVVIEEKKEEKKQPASAPTATQSPAKKESIKKTAKPAAKPKKEAKK